MTNFFAERDDRQRQQSAAQSGEQAEPGFKPVALPALAAAVRATASRPKRPDQAARRDVPAILRKEAMTD